MVLPWKNRWPTEEHETAFVARLPRICQWARQLAKQQDLADDLAQEAFIVFTGAKPDLEGIRNLDAYLFTLLRNLYRSELGRAWRFQQFPPDLDPADPADLRTEPTEDRLAASRGDLLALCQFALRRRYSSKGGSVVLLRFFHGYPVERVAEIMGTTRPVVAERLRLARREAREALSKMRSVDFSAVRLLDADDPGTLRAQLRETVYLAAEGRCLLEEELRILYPAGRLIEVDRKTLAHIVCCRHCLQQIENWLDRRREDDDSTRPSASKDELLARWRRERDDRLQTEPRELRVTVNGQILGACRIAAQGSQLRLSVMCREPIDFVEVFTERDKRLALLPIEPPPEGRLEQTCQIAVVSGRRLSLRFAFDSPWPSLVLDYGPKTTPEPVVADVPVRTAANCRWSSAPAVPAPPRSWISWLSLPRLSPLLASLLIAVLLFVSNRQTTLSAAEVLHMAALWQQRSVMPGTALKRVFLYERESAGKTLRRTVEVWSNPERAVIINRLLDEDGKLLETVTPVPAGVSRAEELWRVVPSANMFDLLSIPLSQVRVEQSDGRFQLTSAQARLVLDRDSGQPLASEIRLGAEVHRFRALAIEAVPVRQSPFAPPPEARRRDLEPPQDVPQAAVPDLETLELKTRRALLLGRDEFGTLEVTVADAAVQVNALATDQAQREWIQSLLSGLNNVRIHIRTLEEAALESGGAITEVLPEAPLKQNHPLLKAVLDRSFRSREQAQQHADRIMAAHHRVLADARCLHEWAVRYKPDAEIALRPNLRQELRQTVAGLVASLRERMGQRDELVLPLLAAHLGGSGQTAVACTAWQDAAVELENELWKQKDALLLLFHESTTTEKPQVPLETVLGDFLSAKTRIGQILSPACELGGGF